MSKPGKFDNAAGFAAQVEKALADPRSRASILRFHEQMYSSIEYSGITKDNGKFPLFRVGMGADMREDLLRTVSDVIDQGGGVSQLLTTRTGYLNARLAPLYGVSSAGLTDSGYVKTNLPAERSGVFTRVGWLAWSAGPTRSGAASFAALRCSTTCFPRRQQNRSRCPKSQTFPRMQ